MFQRVESVRGRKYMSRRGNVYIFWMTEIYLVHLEVYGFFCGFERKADRPWVK